MGSDITRNFDNSNDYCARQHTAACSGNPHDSGTSGNPHDSGESGNPHDTTVQTHHGPNPEADTCPGSK